MPEAALAKPTTGKNSDDITKRCKHRRHCIGWASNAVAVKDIPQNAVDGGDPAKDNKIQRTSIRTLLGKITTDNK